MGTFVGIVLIVLITLIAGLIAYIGDRVGHQVGRRRMTMFGLRPKHTSTIVAVGTGMLIALAVTISAISASYYVRAAFFHLEDINNKVNELQAQADALEHHVRESNVVAEPYITGEVWRKVEVKPCKVGPTFAAPSLRGA